MKPRLTIALTGLNAIDSPGPGIAVTRGLRESPHFEARIIGLAYENLEPGIYMHDLIDKSYQIPYPTAGHEALLERLRYIHEKEQLDLVIPNFDAELLPFMHLRETLAGMGIHSLLPTLEQFDARLKGNLPEFGEKYGIPVPRSEVVLHLPEVANVTQRTGFPVMVKGKFYDAYLAHNLAEAESYFFQVRAKWGTPVVFQQFIDGQEVNVTALGDGKGQLIGAVPMRKTYITDRGKAWAGISINDPDLLAMSRKVVEETRWGGGLELELIKEHETETIYLIEINPRFPAWVYLAVGCGQNHPEALARLAMGEEVAPFETYESGKLFIRYSYDMICSLEEFAQLSMAGEL